MHVEQLRLLALEQEAVTEDFPFGEVTLVFRINGKIFMLMALDQNPPRVNLKCDPEKAVLLRDQYPENVLPGFHMNKKHWNTVVTDGHISVSLMREMIGDSYALVRGKKK